MPPWPLLSLAVWCIVVAAAATSVAVKRPAVGARLAKALVGGLIAGWLIECAIGIAVQVMQGRGPDAIATNTPLHVPHEVFGHLLVLLTWTTGAATIPIAIERAARTPSVLRLVAQMVFAAGSLVLILLASFTGYLGHPPVTVASYLRFRVLHTVAVPFLATISLLCWYVVVRGYRGGVGAREPGNAG